MRFLLDTHILLGSVEGDISRYGQFIDRSARDDGNELFASVVSVWELVIKWRLGKLNLNKPPNDYPSLLEDIGVTLLPVRALHVFASYEPKPPTRDPFDRLLFSICRAEGCQLLTADRALGNHPLAWSGKAGLVDPL